MLSLMYDSGARVQEIIDLLPSSINFNRPYTVRITGKGNKKRIVPLMENQVELLKEYMSDEIGVKDGEIIAMSKGLHLYDYSWELARTASGMI